MRLIRIIQMFIRKWNEALILFPIAFICLCFAPVVLHKIDPTAAVYDLGWIMKFIYAVNGTLICHFTAWLMLRFSFPSIHDYIYHRMNWDLYKDLASDVKGEIKYRNECKRLRYSLILFSLYLFTFIAILFAV